jgi:hypothetical protein
MWRPGLDRRPGHAGFRWTKWQHNRVFSEYFHYFLSVSFDQWPMLIFHSSSTYAMQFYQSTPLLNKILFSEAYTLTNICALSVEENFSDESGNTVKPVAIADYNTCMDCVDKNGQLATCCSLSRRILK